jgi:High potential iron-sulfur protein
MSANESADQTRRKVCKVAGMALALIPVVVVGKTAFAATDSATHSTINAKARAELHYQDTPKDGMKCLTCLEYVPGAKEGFGTCKVIPNDDGISAEGYCISWNTM